MKKKTKKKALWCSAFPEQMDNHVEKAKASERTLYRKEAKAFIERKRKFGKLCPVVMTIGDLRNGFKYGKPISPKLTEVHHLRGRKAGLLRDKRFWMACSRLGHRWIHENVEEARKRGWLCAKGEWNTLPK